LPRKDDRGVTEEDPMIVMTRRETERVAFD
jgi:hypothetical protein